MKNNAQNGGKDFLMTTLVISIIGTIVMVKLNEPTPYIQPEPYSGNTDNIYQLKDDNYNPSKSSDNKHQPKSKTIQYEIPDRDLNPNRKLDRYIQDYLEDNPDVIEDYLDDY